MLGLFASWTLFVQSDLSLDQRGAREMIGAQTSTPARTRNELLPPKVMAIGDIVLDFPYLWGEKERCRVSLVSASILEVLERNKSRFISSDQLYLHFREHNYWLTNNAIAMGISRLRKALCKTSTMVGIETRISFGYRLIVDK